MASNEQEGRAAYNAMLFAIGNNHAGLLYPAALPAAPLLVRVARVSEGWVRWAALEILIEFTAVDVDREQLVAPSGAVVHTKKAIIAAIRSLLGDLELIAQDEHRAVPTAQSARDLLAYLLDEGNTAAPVDDPMFPLKVVSRALVSQSEQLPPATDQLTVSSP